MIQATPVTVGDLIAAGGVILTFVGIMARVLGAFKKYSDAIDAKIAAYEVESDKKRARIYERLDIVKKSFEEKYVSREVFQLMNEGYMRSVGDIKKELDELKHDVKILLTRNGGKDK